MATISSMPTVLLSLRVVTAWNEGRRGLPLAARIFATPRSSLSGVADRNDGCAFPVLKIRDGGKQAARQAQGDVTRHDNAMCPGLHTNVVAGSVDQRRSFNPIVQFNPRKCVFSVAVRRAGTWLTKSLSLLVFQRFRGG